MFRAITSFTDSSSSAVACDEHEASPAPFSARGESVAVIDDEEIMITVTRTVLEKLGYSPVTFSSAGSFLKAFRADPVRFDVIVTDLVMPGMTGAQLAKTLRDTGHEIPILLMTGFGVQPRPHWGIGSGRTAFVRKPFTPVQLAQAVRRLLRN